MDSINKNQEEKNHENLRGKEAIEKVKELVKKAGSCFFCTTVKTSETDGARPMSVQKVDDDGNLWFLSASDSHKNLEIGKNNAVKLYFQGSPHSDFMELSGIARITTDRAIIHDLWEPVLKTWFTEGEDDPRITAIRFIPRSGYYWDTKHGNAVAGIKMLIGAISGKTRDDSIEGTLDV